MAFRPRCPLPLALLFASFVGFLLAGCEGEPSGGTPSETGTTEGRPRVLAVNYPLAYFAERIGGDMVEVEFPAPSDIDPAFWKPSASEIATFQTADLILRNGAEYAKWMKTASLPESVIVDTSKDFSDSLIVFADAGTHSHGEEGEHSHDGIAFTTWLDMAQAIEQAKSVKEALSSLVPEQAASFEARFESLRAELEAIDAELALAAQALGETPLLASHPVHQYAARRYGLHIRSVLWEPDVVPDDAALEDLSRLRKDHPGEVMLWEAEPAAQSVERLQAMGVTSVVFDPCGNRPDDDGDFLSVMRSNIEALIQAADLSD